MIHKLKKIFNKNTPKSDTFRLIGNINWLALDRIVRMGGGVFVNAAVSRYLGPESMGKWDTALAFMGVYVVFSALGSERILTRDLVDATENKKSEILGTAAITRIISSLVFSIICAFSILFLNTDDPEQVTVGIIISIGIFFQAADIITYFYQANLLSKRIVQTKTIAFIVSSVLKLILIYLNAELIAFASTYLIEVGLSSILLLRMYQKNENRGIRSWTFSFIEAQKQLKEGGPLLISGLAYMIYVRADQLMIGEMLTKTDVGVYSRAIKLYEIPMAIYGIFATTLFPKLTSLFKDDERRFMEGYKLSATLMTFIAYLGVIVTWLVGQYVILVLYGEQYSGAIKVLNVLMIGIVFLYNAGQRGNYLLLNGLYNIIIINAVLSAVLNIVLNYYLIPKYGILGAAWASVITQFFVLELSNLFFKGTRNIFYIQLKALFLIHIHRYIYQIKNKI